MFWVFTAFCVLELLACLMTWYLSLSFVLSVYLVLSGLFGLLSLMFALEVGGLFKFCCFNSISALFVLDLLATIRTR